MTIIRSTHRAAKAFKCQEDMPGFENHLWSGGIVERGEIYVRSALTPHDNDIGNVGWQVLRLCQSCADGSWR